MKLRSAPTSDLSRFADDIYEQHHDFHFLDGDEVHFRHSATPMVYARASGILRICESKAAGEEIRRSQRETFPRLAGALYLAVDAGILAKGSGVFIVTGDYPYEAGVLVQQVRPVQARGHDRSSLTAFFKAEKQMTRDEFITFFPVPPMTDLEILAPGQLSLFELADVANREHELSRSAAYSMVEHWIRAGQALLEAKEQVAHGEWLPWLQENFKASERQAQRYMTLAANTTRVADLDTPGLSLRGVLKRLERVNREESLDGEVPLLPVVVGVDIRHGDLRTVLDDLTGQVDAIVTDPPYPAEFLPEYDALGELASRLLVPDGLLVAMVGQTHLPEYIARVGAHIPYRWCGAYLTDGPATRVFGRDVGSKWKPLLIFGGSEFITQDVFKSRADDKEHHHWGQSESGMADIIERLTNPGQLVVDPFIGGGTTAVVCRDLGRRFAGCDTDAQAVATTHERLANADPTA